MKKTAWTKTPLRFTENVTIVISTCIGDSERYNFDALNDEELEPMELANNISVGEDKVDKALHDDDPCVRMMAVKFLGRMSTSAVLPLIDALKDEDSDVRWTAAAALGTIADASAAEALIEALRDEDLEVRLKVTETLGSLGNAIAVEPLIEASREAESLVRCAAIVALGKIGHTGAVGLLSDALHDDNWEVRKSAAWALGKIGDSKAVAPLIAALCDDHPVVRKRAAEALGTIGYTAINPLENAMRDIYWLV